MRPLMCVTLVQPCAICQQDADMANHSHTLLPACLLLLPQPLLCHDHCYSTKKSDHPQSVQSPVGQLWCVCVCVCECVHVCLCTYVCFHCCSMRKSGHPANAMPDTSTTNADTTHTHTHTNTPKSTCTYSSATHPRHHPPCWHIAHGCLPCLPLHAAAAAAAQAAEAAAVATAATRKMGGAVVLWSDVRSHYSRIAGGFVATMT